jgi:exodeoxyribonuclease X
VTYARYFVGDTETTGASPEDGVCELAWVEIDEHLGEINRQHSMIDPQRPISFTASGVHGITNKDVEEAPTLDEFFDVVLPPLYFHPSDDVVLIAHNADFDKRYLGRRMPIKRTLCTLRLARRVWPEMENHKLATLMYALNLTRGKSHSADGDVETCLDLLRKIVEATGSTLPELVADAEAPIFISKMPFGKHKDVPLPSVDKSYIRWALSKLQLDRDLKWSLEQVLAGKMPA